MFLSFLVFADFFLEDLAAKMCQYFLSYITFFDFLIIYTTYKAFKYFYQGENETDVNRQNKWQNRYISYFFLLNVTISSVYVTNYKVVPLVKL